MQGSTRIDELRQKFHENPRRYFAPLANEYRKAGDPEQAIAICRAHLAQQPGHMSGHVVYGQALYDARRPDEARSVFEKALSLDPDNPIVLKHLGDIAREQGESAEARHWYGKALDIDPLDAEVAAYIAELTEPVTGDAGQPSVEAAIEHAPRVEAEADILDDVELEAQQGIDAASPADDQGDGFEESADSEPQKEVGEPPRRESTFVTTDFPVEVEYEDRVEDEPIEPIELQTAEAAALDAVSDDVGTSEAVEDEAGAPEQRAEDVAWRNTPQPQKSPFVTRTMAELYASQGYPDAALDIYRQLAIQHPDDMEIRDRIDELSTTGPELSEPFSFSELTDDVVYQPTSDDLSLSGDAPPPTEAVHFSETALGDGSGVEAGFEASDFTGVTEISWDGSLADFSEISLDDPVGDAAPSEPQPTLEATVEEEAEPVVEQEVSLAELETNLGEVSAVDDEVGVAVDPADTETSGDSPVDGTGGNARFVELPVALGEFQTSIDEAGMATTSRHESDVEPVESEVVAYSPELPAREDLPHYTPKSPTIREFFATLGARRPPDPAAAESFTARAAIPGAPAQQPADDLPLATDAFDSLFPDDPPVSAEDTRAAFALSGALGGATHNPVPSSLRTSPPLPVPAVPEPAPGAQESEEDIRRFREWLDGLADS